MNKFYLTTAIPYVNAKPHVGHALEFVQADTIARYHKLSGDNTLLLSGGDENALKNVQAAEKAGKEIQSFVDENSKLFQDLAEKLNVEFDFFQKGSSTDHHTSSQELWKLCEKNDDIYKKEYSGLYCVGCELFYEPPELDKNGECFEHPGKKLETVTEENYFFKLSKYQEQIKELIEKDSIKIIPDSRKNEVLSFLKQGLTDISISRSNNRAKNWGVPVPGDDSQRMYVWFDALNIYRSGLKEKYDEFWPADLHIIGKGITRFHAIYWPAFLLSAKIALPKSIFVHGYFTVNGQKMSKTLGNVIDPIELIEKYGADALRYYLLREIPSTGDGDFSESRFKEVYNADLANELGNLVARVAKLIEINKIYCGVDETKELSYEVEESLKILDFNLALKSIWDKVKGLNRVINEKKPWEKEGLHQQVLWNELSNGIRQIGFDLEPFLPETSRRIKDQFGQKEIKSSLPLFPRL